MLKKVMDSFRLPETKRIKDLDHFSTTELHTRIIQEKPFLRNIYLDFYQEYQELLKEKKRGVFFEIGSGGGFIKEIYPQVITSDILRLRDLDICCDAQKLPIKGAAVDGFFLINVFHHICDPMVFLKELNRCLKPGGKIICVEPANTVWARFIYTHFHHENFDTQSGWQIMGDGPLSAANGALPWIVFKRDRAKFSKAFPSLKVADKIKYFMPVRYLISGGLTFKQLLPSFCYYPVKMLEWFLSPFNKWLGMFFVITITKE